MRAVSPVARSSRLARSANASRPIASSMSWAVRSWSRASLRRRSRRSHSPSVIDTGAWDAFGEQGKADYFADISSRNPARRIGTTDDIANGVLFAMTSTFLTGQTLHIDGGEPLT